MKFLIVCLVFFLIFASCMTDDIESLLNGFEKYDISQFHNLKIYPRDGDDKSQYYVTYFDSFTDSLGILKRRKALFLVALEKQKDGSIKSLANLVGDTAKLIFCREHGIDTSSFNSHIHNLFNNFLLYSVNSIENIGGKYLMEGDKYNIAYLDNDAIKTDYIKCNYIKYNNNWYYLVVENASVSD